MIQKSDDNMAYYNQYCNKNKSKIDKKNIFKETISSNVIKKTKANLSKRTKIKSNIFEMINNINNINIFANNIKQNHNMYYKCNGNNNSSFCSNFKNDILKQNNNMYFKSISNNNNSSFCNNYKNDILKQYNNNTYHLNHKKK